MLRATARRAAMLLALLAVSAAVQVTAAGAAEAATTCPAGGHYGATLFFDHDAAYWHHRYWKATHGKGPAYVRAVTRPRQHTTFGCPASVSHHHSPGYWYHQLRLLTERLNVRKVAVSLLGTPYLFGGDGPGGFDCSGFVDYVFRHSIGKVLPRTTFLQWRSHLGRPVGRRHLKVGDVVFFYPTSSGPDHAGIYVGGGVFIDAPHTGARVRRNLLRYYPEWVGARRFIR